MPKRFPTSFLGVSLSGKDKELSQTIGSAPKQV